MQNSFRPTVALGLYVGALLFFLAAGATLQLRWGLWGIAAGEIFGMLLPVLLGSRLLHLKLYFCRPTLKDALSTCIQVVLVVFLASVLLALQEKFWPNPEELRNFYAQWLERGSLKHEALKIFSLALLPACCEELFFRGLLFSAFQPSLRPVSQMLLNAALFAIAHANPWYFSYYFLLGCFLAWLQYSRQNLTLCMVAHFTNNLIGLYGPQTTF